MSSFRITVFASVSFRPRWCIWIENSGFRRVLKWPCLRDNISNSIAKMQMTPAPIKCLYSTIVLSVSALSLDLPTEHFVVAKVQNKVLEFLLKISMYITWYIQSMPMCGHRPNENGTPPGTSLIYANDLRKTIGNEVIKIQTATQTGYDILVSLVPYNAVRSRNTKSWQLWYSRSKFWTPA